MWVAIILRVQSCPPNDRQLFCFSPGLWILRYTIPLLVLAIVFSTFYFRFHAILFELNLISLSYSPLYLFLFFLSSIKPLLSVRELFPRTMLAKKSLSCKTIFIVLRVFSIFFWACLAALNYIFYTVLYSHFFTKNINTF